MSLAAGESTTIQGSGKTPYVIKNHDDRIWSCSCVSWRNSGGKVDLKSCKHLRIVNPNEAARLASNMGGVVVQAIPVAPVAPEAVSVAPDGYPTNPEPDKKFTCTPERAREVLERAAKEGRKLRPDEKQDLFGPPLILAHKFSDYPELDPTGWLWSTKLDGCRAWYEDGKFISREGNEYKAPDWFKDKFPNEVLDGELYMGKQSFQKTMSIVRTESAGDRWKEIRFMVFDAPKIPGTFRERLAKAKELLEGVPFASVHEHRALSGKQELIDLLKFHVGNGEEGLMLRDPNSEYSTGRSKSLLKVKLFQDAEAKVVEYNPGKGRHKGVMGGLIVEMPNGKTFNIGTGFTDADRRNPPPIGSYVTYTFTETTSDGIPKCVSFLRVRPPE